MLNKIKTLLQKVGGFSPVEDLYKSQELSFRIATIDDLDFIHTEIVKEAKNGHFSSSFYIKPVIKDALKYNLESIITTHRRLDENLVAYAYIAEYKGNLASFIILTKQYFDDKESTEIWMAATKQQYRNKGIAQNFIDIILTELKSTKSARPTVYSRCLKNSENMYKILIKKGFLHEKTDENGTTFLVYTL